jgi:hypothetical protein
MSIVRASRTPSLDARALVRGGEHPLFLYLLAWIVSVTSVTAGSVSKIDLACVSPSLVLPTSRFRIERGECIRGQCRLLTCDLSGITAGVLGEIGNRWERLENRTDGLWHVGAWDVWRESGRRASKPKGPPSHAETATFLRSRFAWRRGSYRFYSRRHRHNGTLARPI